MKRPHLSGLKQFGSELFLFLLWERSLRTQMLAAAGVPLGTWLLYTLYPTKGIDLMTGAPALGITPAWLASAFAVVASTAGNVRFLVPNVLFEPSQRFKGGKVGPALDDVAQRRTPEWMMQHFRDPQSVTPGTVMPRFGFTETEARALTDFLLHMREQKLALSLPSQMIPVERGHEVYRKYGCAGCHGVEGKGGVPNPNSKTAEQVPGLLKVAEGYTKDELKARILRARLKNHD